MKLRYLVCALITLATMTGCHHIRPLAGTPDWERDPGYAAQLTAEENNGNGIEVGSPKVYDDASLRMMLDATRARLAAMSGLNQDALISRLGSISGATISQTQFGLQVTGPSAPGVTPANTESTQTGVTTSPEAAPPATPSVAGGLAFTPPTSVSASALDVLNEQMQLSYEMTNLQLLLEGALSDRFVASQRFVKPRVTLGFPISLRAPPAFRDAAAVVEVEVEAIRPLSSEAPAITALLPRERTYNVAAMTDRTTSIGAGVVLGMVGLSGTFFQGRKTLYLVQDQDTVALQRSTDRNRGPVVSFLWEFHPVLGQHFVRSGLKQTFVQLAMPTLPYVECFGMVTIRTYWRRFNQKDGTTGAVIPGSVLVSKRTFPIPRFDLAPSVEGVNFQDLGDGTVLVSVQGAYLAGTYVQLGPTRYEPGKNLVTEETGLRFVAPMAALAQWTGHVVARSGAQTDLLQPLAQKPLPTMSMAGCHPHQAPSGSLASASSPSTQLPTCEEFKITSVIVARHNNTQSTVNVEIETPMDPPSDQEILLKIGEKIVPFKGENLKRVGNTSRWIITTVVPNSDLESNLSVRVFTPSQSDTHEGEKRCHDAMYAPECEEFKINSVTTAPLNETSSTVRLEISTPMRKMFYQELLLEIGGKVFGLKDAIVKRERNESGPIITAVVPTALLVSSPRVRVFRPFWSDMDGYGKHCYDDRSDLTDFGQDSEVERLVPVSVAANGDIVYILYGNGLNHAKILVPGKGATLAPIGNVGPERIRLLTITKSALATTKKIVLQKADGQRPLVLDVPDLKATPPKVTIDSPVIQNTDELDASAEDATDIVSVKMGKKALKWKPVDNSTIRLLSLKADGVTDEQKSREITIQYKGGVEVTVKFEVVAERIGVK